MVHVPPSCMLDGVHSQHFFGTVVIIYHSETMGLSAVDRNTVAVSISDVMPSFAAFPMEIPGEVVFLHPVQNFALVAYDPSALGADASIVHAVELLPGKFESIGKKVLHFVVVRDVADAVFLTYEKLGASCRFISAYLSTYYPQMEL